ncbi:MAG: carbohydrate-binding family 9-like protein [Planctomycetota bacterium]
MRKRFFLPLGGQSSTCYGFRSLFDDEFFYFSFRVHDEDVVVEKKFDAESVVDREDRVEIFFARGDKLKEYFCLEVDPLGRIHDYAASYYRKFDSSWSCRGIRTAGSITKQGYSIEGSIPLRTLETLGLPSQGSGHMLRAGLFRAEFNHGPESAPEAHWISWIDPGTEQPDFHVPGAFGCLWVAK